MEEEIRGCVGRGIVGTYQLQKTRKGQKEQLPFPLFSFFLPPRAVSPTDSLPTTIIKTPPMAHFFATSRRSCPEPAGGPYPYLTGGLDDQIWGSREILLCILGQTTWASWVVALGGGGWGVLGGKKTREEKKSPYIALLGHPFIAYANVHV